MTAGCYFYPSRRSKCPTRFMSEGVVWFRSRGYDVQPFRQSVSLPPSIFGTLLFILSQYRGEDGQSHGHVRNSG